jgi:hypothetical protein
MQEPRERRLPRKRVEEAASFAAQMSVIVEAERETRGYPPDLVLAQPRREEFDVKARLRPNQPERPRTKNRDRGGELVMRPP